MVNTAVLVSLIAAVANAQGVTESIAPSGAAPSGCSASFDGKFGFYISTLSARYATRCHVWSHNDEMLTQFGSATPTATAAVKPRALLEDSSSSASRQAANAVIEARSDDSEDPVACATDNTLTMTLDGTILKDSKDRIAYIASNRQFQFDGPPQAGAIYTAGFTACDDGAIALGDSKTFWQCLSGDFYNLYDQYWAPQCMPVQMMIVRLMDCEKGEMISKAQRKDVQR